MASEKPTQHRESRRIGEGGTDGVHVRAGMFNRLQSSSYCASPWTDEEMDMLAAEDADSLGWEGMEAYQDHEP